LIKITYAFLISTCPAHTILLDLITLVRVQIVKLIIMQFYSAFCHFLSCRPKYSPQHSVPKHWIHILKVTDLSSKASSITFLI
jgi:hypothetical protein